MKAHYKYLKYVLRHKWFVFLGCLHYGIIWRGITHDWTKFLPCEWFPYVNFFYRGAPSLKSGASAPKKPDGPFELAWNHHQKRNDHHWQHWVRVADDGGVGFEGKLLPLPMSDTARKEMLADWRGAGRALGKPDTKAWYLKNKENMLLNSATREWIEKELKIYE